MLGRAYTQASLSVAKCPQEGNVSDLFLASVNLVSC